MTRLSLFQNRSIATSPDVLQLLRAGAAVGIGVSGGKDSSALAIATNEYLDSIEHAGPRILIHSGLGRVEWKDSAPACRRIAAATGLELVTVRRAAGGMMERWLKRWENNVHRYANLLCVKLILPWSTAKMRFCTSELKTAVICRELIRRFPGLPIVSATGIRADESSARSKMPIASPQPKLTSRLHRTFGIDWHPILKWTLPDVFGFLEERSFPLHEAYVRYGSSRVSCVFCIMSSKADLRAATTCVDNADIYREMVSLEARSSFSFQESGWLGDVAPQLLDDSTRAALLDAKRKASIRQRLEANIPPHLVYTKGWPTVMPTKAEAEILAGVRWVISTELGFRSNFLDAESILARYAELMSAKAAKGAA